MRRPNINLKNTGATLISATKSNAGNFYARVIRVVITSATAITVPATISIGTNSTSYNNILVATALTALTTVDTILTIPLAAVSSLVASEGEIYANVSVAALGTSISATIDIIGDYEGA